MDRKIYIVEDDQDFSSYLAELTKKIGFASEVFGTGEDFLREISPAARGCIVADIRLPGMNGLAMLEQARKTGVELPSIVLSGYATVKKAVDAIKGGAITLIEKPMDESEFCDAVKAAMAEEDLQHGARSVEAAYRECYQSLSKGERDVLRCIVKGMPNKNIAFDLDVSLRTIESRRRKVFQKMKAQSVAELVALAISAKHHISVDIEDIAI